MVASVFISHSSRDFKEARKLVAALESRGINCWLSERDIGAGDNYGDAIVDAIERAPAMVLIFSANANNSEEIKKEIALASQRKITVIPVRLEDVAPSKAFRYELVTRNWIDFFIDWDEGLQRLVDRIFSIEDFGSGREFRPPAPEPKRQRMPIWLFVLPVLALIMMGAGYLWTRYPTAAGVAGAAGVKIDLDGASKPISSAGDSQPQARGAAGSLAMARGSPPDINASSPLSKGALEAGGAAASSEKSSAESPPPSPPPSASAPQSSQQMARAQPPAAPAAPPEQSAPSVADSSAAPPSLQTSPPQSAGVPPAPFSPSAHPNPEATSVSPGDQTAAVPAPSHQSEQPTPAREQASKPAPLSLPVAQSTAAQEPTTPPAPAVVPQPTSTQAAAPTVPPEPVQTASKSSREEQPVQIAAVQPQTPSRAAVEASPPEPVQTTAKSSQDEQPVQMAAMQPQAPNKAATAAEAKPLMAIDPNTAGGQVFRECDKCPEMVVIPRGAALLGSPPQESGRQSNEPTPHEVDFAQPFAVGRFDVTFDEWDACLAEGGCNNWRPGDFGFGRGRRPVIFVSWDDAQNYVAWLKQKTGKAYRLLSEAEWEYAARGCATTKCPNAPFWFGRITPELANYDSRYAYEGSPKGIAQKKTSPVNEGSPNPFGLYNMIGNVRQWVADCWSAAPGPPRSDPSPRVAGDCADRAVRGGAWADKPQDLRAAARSWAAEDERSPYTGIRVARSLEP
jgi:formylglycine-generating enzyme required for sulfatase activity